MGKFRGFRMKRHLLGFTRWIFHRPGRRAHPSYHRLERSASPFSRLLWWGHRLTSKTRSLCSAGSSCSPRSGGYLPLGAEPETRDKPGPVPKGHLAVYVGQKDGEFRRVLVPMIYFNHPLFGELLREAEEEFGFNQQGGLTIPCGFSDFERIKTCIAATGCGGRRKSWNRRS